MLNALRSPSLLVLLLAVGGCAPAGPAAATGAEPAGGTSGTAAAAPTASPATATAADSTTPSLQVGGAAGVLAPDFAALDHAGVERSLAAARARGPVVLLFYRGHW